jgi:5-methylcytosine-specific restriction protein B
MRRRFSFIRVEPNYGLLEKRIAGAGTDPAPLMNAINALNKEINDPDYFVGISFFIMDVAHLVEQLPSIWDGEILPYVRDHFFGRPEVIARFSWPNVNAEFFGAWYAPEAKPADH